MRKERVLEITEKEKEIDRIRELASIEDRLIEKMGGERPALDDNLIDGIADWYTWFKKSGQTASACTADWHVYFFQWALKGRCQEFHTYIKKSDNLKSLEALKALKLVLDFKQPWRPSKKNIFHALWGWFQEEMEKQGYEKPRPVEERICELFDDFKRKNQKIKSYHIDGCGELIFMLSTSGDEGDYPCNGLPTQDASSSLDSVAFDYLGKDPSYFYKDCLLEGTILMYRKEEIADAIMDSCHFTVPGNMSKEHLLEIATSMLPKYIPPDSTDDISEYPRYIEDGVTDLFEGPLMGYRIKEIKDEYGNEGFCLVLTEYYVSSACQCFVGVYGTIELAMRHLKGIGKITGNVPQNNLVV